MRLFSFLLLSIAWPWHQSLAIPPPDLITSGLQSVVQVFGVAVAFLVSAFFLLKDTLKVWWQLYRRWMIAALVLVLLMVVFLISWLMGLWA